MELGRVFVSSVFGGMLDLRQLAADAARLVGLEPVLTERHAAQVGAVRDALARENRALRYLCGPLRPPSRHGANLGDRRSRHYRGGIPARPRAGSAASRLRLG